MGDLEPLEAVAAFSFFSDDVEDGVDEFGSFGVMSLGPVVSGSGLSEHEVVGSEELSEGSGAHGVHGSGFQVHQDGSGNVSSSGGLVEVDVDSLQLEVGISVIGSGRVDSVLVGNNLPEFSSDLVTALSCLYVNDFSHLNFIKRF